MEQPKRGYCPHQTLAGVPGHRRVRVCKLDGQRCSYGALKGNKPPRRCLARKSRYE